MITIRSSEFSVDLLDPRADTDMAMTGSRYCVGGYIWQAYDKVGRALLSGPHFPSSNPPPFDGQGMPEVFEMPLGGEDGAVGDDVCVIGVGLVKKTSGMSPFHPRNNPHVTKPCGWDVTAEDSRVIMVTAQSHGDKSIELRREVLVTGSGIESVSSVCNTGSADITLRWFSHPFFPLNTDLSCGKIGSPVILPESAGYNMDAGGMIRMKPEYPWEKGLFQLLEVKPEKLNFAIPHPIAGYLYLQTDYNVIRLALWANAKTFSFEPFMQRTIKPKDNVTWKVLLYGR